MCLVNERCAGTSAKIKIIIHTAELKIIQLSSFLNKLIIKINNKYYYCDKKIVFKSI